jgi:predicted dehydrogenase
MGGRKRRGAIVGFGFIAQCGHLPAYSRSEDLEIVAVADVSEERRRAAARAIPGVRLYTDHDTLIARERGAIEFVDVTTPPYAHATVAWSALEAGLHVLCEKPLTTSVPDARSLVKLAERSRRVLYPSHNYKHSPVVRRVRELLADGAIGAPHLVTLATFRNTHARGVPEWRESWRRERQFAGGGITMDHGSHTFYLAFEWLRAYPTSITAKMTRSGRSDTEDTVSATVTFPTGTAQAHLTWTAGVRKVIYTIHGPHGAIRVEDDAIEITSADGETLRTRAPRWTRADEAVASHWMDASHSAWFCTLLDDFSSAIARNDWVSRETQDALRCVELIGAAYASARSGAKEVSLPSARLIDLFGPRRVVMR